MNFYKPLLMPRGSHYGSNYWEVYSSKMQRKACFFSNLEYENFLLLEINPKVKAICEQPMAIEVIIDGKLKKSVFDMWVKYSDDTEEMQEVKYSASLKGDSAEAIKNREQIRRQQLWCNENNIPHTIRSELEIHAGQYTIFNASFIASRVRRYEFSTNIQEYVSTLKGFMQAYTKTNISTLINSGILPLGNELNFLCYAHYKGVIELDIHTKPIDNKSEVFTYGQ